MKILYAEDLAELRELYAMAIEAETNGEVVEFSCGNDLISYLKNNGEASLILCDHNMPKGNGSDVYRYVKETGNQLPFGLLSSDEYTAHAEFKTFLQDHPHNFSVVKPFSIPQMLQYILKAIHADAPISAPDYIPIRMDRFEKLNPLPVDAYIKSSESYVKLLSVGELYSREHHGKHQEKYGKYLYVTKDQYAAMLQEGIRKLKLEPSTKCELGGTELVHHYVNAIGIDEKIVAAADAICYSVMENFRDKNNAFSILLKQMGDRGYLYEHSLLSAYVCCGIADQANQTPFFSKLVTAALFHDLGLDDELSKVSRYEEVISLSLGWEKSQQITEHPMKNYEMLKKVSDLPADVDLIVFCHHERPNGTGFPRGLQASDTPLIACFFIVAETFVSQIIDKEPNAQLFESVCKAMQPEFMEGNYREPFEALKRLVKCK